MTFQTISFMTWFSNFFEPFTTWSVFGFWLAAFLRYRCLSTVPNSVWSLFYYFSSYHVNSYVNTFAVKVIIKIKFFWKSFCKIHSWGIYSTIMQFFEQVSPKMPPMTELRKNNFRLIPYERKLVFRKGSYCVWYCASVIIQNKAHWRCKKVDNADNWRFTFFTFKEQLSASSFCYFSSLHSILELTTSRFEYRLVISLNL